MLNRLYNKYSSVTNSVQILIICHASDSTIFIIKELHHHPLFLEIELLRSSSASCFIIPLQSTLGLYSGKQQLSLL